MMSSDGDNAVERSGRCCLLALALASWTIRAAGRNDQTGFLIS